MPRPSVRILPVVTANSKKETQDDAGHVMLKKRLTREALLPFIAQLSPVVIGMEACGGAHYWARRFRGYGHTVKLIAPQFVKPYVKTNKNDWADAEAICEAVTRPTMRFVPIKEVEQQDLQSLHRARERVVKARTALVNEIRGLAMEYGLVFPHSVTKLRHTFAATLEAEQDKLTPLSAELFRQLYDEFGTLEKRLAYYNEKRMFQRCWSAILLGCMRRRATPKLPE